MVQCSWFDKWEWLHWDESSERVLCFTFVSAFKEKKLKCVTADTAFITRGHQNWKDAILLRSATTRVQHTTNSSVFGKFC